MNEYPAEWTEQEESPARPHAEPRPRRRAPEMPPPRPRQSARRGGNGLSMAALVISLLALIAACAALFLTLREEPEIGRAHV